MIPGLILIFIGFVLVAVGIKRYRNNQHLILNGKKATAIIFDNIYKRGSSGGLYYPVFRFLTDKNEWITRQYNIGYSRASKTGTEIEVLYDPDNPENFSKNNIFILEYLPGLLKTAGLAMLIIGLFHVMGILNLFTNI